MLDGGCRDEDAAARSSPGRRAYEGDVFDICEALVGVRWLELAERSHLRGRREQARLESPPRSKLPGSGERAKALEQPLDEVDLRVRERRVEPDAPRRDSVPARSLDRVAPRRTCEVGVVENDAPHAG